MRRLAAALAITAALLAGCGTDTPTTSGTEPTTTTEAAPSTSEAATTTAEATTTLEATIPAAPPAPAAQDPAPAPYITGCGDALGPVITYWSDGTTTGSSPLCQEQHDNAVAAEADAGLKYTCDASACYWPDGSLVPNYQRCGTACGEPPTSGDIQSAWFTCLEQHDETYCRENS